MWSNSSEQQSADEVLANLRENASEYRRKLRFITVAMILVGLGLVATVAFDRWGHAPAGWSSLVEYMPWFLVFVGGAAMMAKQKLQDHAARASVFNDKRMLAPVIELLDGRDADDRTLVYEAVIRLLPQFTKEDFDALSDDQRANLMKSIRSSPDRAYVEVVMNAARKFGCSDCIAPIEDFVSGHNKLRKGAGARAVTLGHMTLADIRMRAAKSQIDLLSGSPSAIPPATQNHQSIRN